MFLQFSGRAALERSCKPDTTQGIFSDFIFAPALLEKLLNFETVAVCSDYKQSSKSAK